MLVYLSKVLQDCCEIALHDGQGIRQLGVPDVLQSVSVPVRLCHNTLIGSIEASVIRTRSFLSCCSSADPTLPNTQNVKPIHNAYTFLHSRSADLPA